MKKTTTSEPKAVWKFFHALPKKSAVFMTADRAGLTLIETGDTEDPPSPVSADQLSRAHWMILLKVLVALRGGRPVKIVPVAGDDDDDDEIRVFVGPK
jgi:hypothetical protein